MTESLRARLSLDARSLAAGRVALAALLCVDLAQRAVDLRAHYTDAGVLPRAAYSLPQWDFLWSLHALGGSAAFEAALFVAAAACAGALLLGYRTFWATLACWVLTVSLHARNPLLRDGQDDLSRVLLFWCLFLPLGAAASLDARAGRKRSPLGSGGLAVTAGALGFVFQLFTVYWTSAIGKAMSPWWTGGDGIYDALHVGRYATRAGIWLAAQPGLRTLSFAVWALEALGPVAWLAAPHWKVRTAVVAAFVSMHAGFAVTMGLGLFPYVSMAAWLFLLPAGLWDRMGWRAPASEPSPGPAWLGRASAAVVGVCAALVVWVNALYLAQDWELPRWPQRAAEVVGLQQYWVLFSPASSNPFSLSDGWLVIPAVLKNGQQVDLEAGAKSVTWERPSVISATFGSARWRHYFANMANLLRPYPRNSFQYRTLEASRVAYARFLCAEWNASHPEGEAIQYLSLVLMTYRIDHADWAPTRELLQRQVCGE